MDCDDNVSMLNVDNKIKIESKKRKKKRKKRINSDFERSFEVLVVGQLFDVFVYIFEKGN